MEEIMISEERLERYKELKVQEKAIAEELDDIKKEIFALNNPDFEVGEFKVKVSERTRMDLNKDNVAKLIEQAVDAGLISKESVAEDYIKSTVYKVITVK